MQCPRCGLQNPPGISACQRCGLAVVQAPPPGTPTTEGASAAVPPTSPEGADDATSVLSTTPEQGQLAPQPGQAGPPPPGYVSPGYAQPSQPEFGQPEYGQPEYGQPGYAQPGYGQGGYAAPPAPSYPSYAPPPATAAYQAYGAPAGSASPYATGSTAPYGTAATWPTDTSSTGTTGGGAGLSRVLLLLGAIASAVYAVWAMTARRGIFADFADNKFVSLSHAKSSDRADTILLVIAGGLAVLALALWLIRLLGGKARGGALTLLGFVLSLAGLVCVVVGLVMSGMVDDGATRVDEGQKAVTSTIVTGSGFIAIAVGLLIGLLVVKARPDADGTTPAAATPAPAAPAAPAAPTAPW